MSDVNLPEGWTLQIFDDVVFNVNGARKPVSLKLRENIKGAFSYYGATGQIDSLNDFTHEGEHILIGEDGANLLTKSKELAFIVDGQFWVNNHAHAVKCLAEVPAKFVSNYINSLDLSSWVTGTAQPKLTKGNLAKIPFPLPPLAEQKVIADKLDTLLAQVETTKARLERIPNILKTFRQSVLAAAVSGKLTEEWREDNHTHERWKVIIFEELIAKIRSGSGDKPTDDVSGVPILRSSAVRPLSIDYCDVRYLNVSDKSKEENYLRNGDLLFTRLSGSAEYVGNCALVRGVEKECQYPDRLFCVRLKDPAYTEYLEYFCNSDDFRQHISNSIKSSAGHQRITLDVINKASISLPPKEEQTEIVRRVEELFAFADVIEQKASAALERVNNLTQSILAKAFRGELTADWRIANPELITGDNSADALLAKIKAEREAMKKQLKKKAVTRKVQ